MDSVGHKDDGDRSSRRSMDTSAGLDIEDFLRSAHEAQVISGNVADRLHAYLAQLSPLADEEPRIPLVSDPSADPELQDDEPDPDAARRAGVTAEHASLTPETPSRRPPVRAPPPSRPDTAVRRLTTQRPAAAKEPGHTAVLATAHRHSLGFLERLQKSTRAMWKTTTADFAANTLTYLGVLLSIIVIFVFFAFGYFGDVVGEANLRPPFFAAVPLFFFGIAWILRTRTGIPAAATAIGMIGALTVPVMISALFRDWAAFPPDLHGPDRYWGYALAGVLSAGIYLWLASRQRIYAYLIVPVLWAAAGSLGLYWRNGISGPQLFTVLAVIIVTFAVISRWHTGRVGGLLAVPAARVGIVAAPFVFVISLVFAYDDAVEAGTGSPGIEDLAQPGAVAAALLALILGLASGMDFAWRDLGPRTRSALRASLRILAYLAVGVAVFLALSLEVTPAWIGVALIGYGIVVWGIDRVVRGTGDAALWIARASILVGAVLAAIEPTPALIVWSGVLLLALGRVQVPFVRSETATILPLPATGAQWLAELWMPAFVVVGAGAARLADPTDVPWVLLVAAAVSVTTRWLPAAIRNLRTYAGFPAVAFAAASYGSAEWIHVQITGYSRTEAGALLLGLAGVTAFVWFSWMWRAPIATGVTIVGAATLAGGTLQAAPDLDTVVATTVLVVAGTALFGASFAPWWSRWAYANGLLGHIYLYAAVAVGIQTADAAIIALGALVGTHAVEAVAAQRGVSPFITRACKLAGPAGSVVEAMPATVAAVAAIPLALLLGRRVSWLREERSRFSLVLVALAWIYAAAALWLRRPARWLLVTLSYLCAVGAIAVAFPSRPASLLAVSAAAASTLAVAIAVRSPGASIVSWLLSVIGTVLLADQVGVDRADLYRVLLAAALLLVVTGAAINTAQGRGPGIRSPWVVPPVLTGLIGLPVALAFSLAADSWIWLIALAAAGAVAGLGWSTRAGGVAAAVAAYAGIAYADALSTKVNIFWDEPVYWMAFAAVLVGVSGFLPGRHGWRLLREPSPGTLLAGLATATMAVVLALGAQNEPPVLLLSALLLGIVWVLRRNDAWLHGASAVLIWAGAAAGGGWTPASIAGAAAIETMLAEVRIQHSSAAVYRWISVALWGTAFAFTLDWLGWSSTTVAAVTLVGGAVLSAATLAVFLVGVRMPLVARWTMPLAGIGQVGLLAAGTYASLTLDRPEALLTWAAAAAVETMLAGTYGTVRMEPISIWLAAGLGATTFGLFSAAAWTEPVDVVRWSCVAGTVALSAWAVIAIVDHPPRLVLWRWQAFITAQIGFGVASTGAISYLGEADAFRVLAAIAGCEAVVIGAVATLTMTTGLTFLSMAFVLASFAATIGGSSATGPGVVSAWMIFTASIAAAVTILGRLPRSDRIGIWIWPLHAGTAVSGVVAVVLAANYLSPLDALRAGAAVAAATAIYLIANRSEFIPYAPVDPLAAIAIVTSGTLMVSTLDRDEPWTIAVLLLVALAGAIAAPVAIRLEGAPGIAAGIVAVGMSSIPIVAATIFWGPLAPEIGWILIMTGGALAAYGAVARRLVALEGAVGVWLVSMLILVNHRFGLEMHGTVVLVSVVLLAVLDVERYRHHRDGETQPEALRIAEWIVMAVPTTLAAAEMFSSLAYGLVLAAEGIALTVWGGLTRVRRRAVVGLIAMTTAILLGTLIPVLSEARSGFTGGTWLLIGAIAAVVLIIAGSLIEKQRTLIGKQLARWGEILEHWE